MATGGDTLPDWAKPLCEKLHFRVKVNGSKSPVCTFDSSILDICKVQFSLSKKQIGQTVALLIKNNIILGLQRNEHEIDIEIKNFQDLELIQPLVETAFQNVISTYECRWYGLWEHSGLALVKQWQDEVPAEIGTKIMIYICRKSDQLFVVGEKQQLEQFITKLLPGDCNSNPSKTSTGLPVSGFQNTTTGLPASGSQNISTGLPASGYQNTSTGLPASGFQNTTTGLPASGSQNISTGLPASGSQNTTTGLPACGSQKTTTLLPASGSQKTTTRLPASGSQKTTTRLPASGSQNTTSLLPASGSQNTTTLLPASGYTKATDGTPVDVSPSASDKSQVFTISLKHALLCHYLGFETFIKEKYADTSVVISLPLPQCKIIYPDKCGSIVWKDEITLFLSEVKGKAIVIVHPLMMQLLFHDNDVPNEQLYNYIREMLEDVDVQFVILNKGFHGVWVCSRNKHSVNIVADIVKTRIRFMNDLFITSKDGWKNLATWAGTNRLVYERCKRKGESVNICCTRDIKHYIIPPSFQFPSGFSIGDTDRAAKFLVSFGQDIIASVEEKYNTCINVSSDEACVYLCGDANKTGEIKKMLKEALISLRLSIPTAVSKEYLLDHQADIDHAMKSRGCSWKLKALNDQQRILSNCIQHVSWHDPLHEKKMFIVEGNVWDVDVDLQIVFTTQNLYPLDDQLPSNPGQSFEAYEKFIDYGMRKIQKEGQQKSGFTTELLTDIKEVGFTTNYLVGMVVWLDANVYNASQITKEQFHLALDVIMKASRGNVRSVGITSSFSANTVDRTLIQAFVEYFMADKNNTIDELNVVICTHNNTDQIKKLVEHSLKEHRGICRKDYSGNQQLSPKDSNFRFDVKLGQFQEHKADVFVNTTNRRLKLDEGALSKSILHQAGSKIQDQCNDDYPTGIAFGDVAVTNAYQLEKSKCGFKKIFHIALKKYDSNCYRQDIEKCVKKCLSLAERENFSKISFPAFGVGRLAYPRREVAACMLNAVNDFCSTCVKPSLKKIKCVVTGDEETTAVFTDEVWRHSKGFGKDTKQSTPIVTSEFRSLDKNLGHVCVKIVTHSDYGTPPSYVVKLLFRGEGVSMKRASYKDCPSWNDEIHVGIVRSVQLLKDCLENKILHAKMNSERITVMAICTDKQTGVSEDLQVVKIVEFFSRTNVFPQLEEVHLVVSSEDVVHNAASLLELDMANFKKKTKPHATFDLIGKSQDALKSVEAYLAELEDSLEQQNNDKSSSSSRASLASIHEKQTQTFTNSVTRDTPSEVDTTTKIATSAKKENPTQVATQTKVHTPTKIDIPTKEATQTKEDDPTKLDMPIKVAIPAKEDTMTTLDATEEVASSARVDTDVEPPIEVKYEVTAQLNPGMVKLNKHSQQWKKWIDEVKTKFQVDINEEDIKQDRCYACGSLDNIVEFEDYLNYMMINFNLRQSERQTLV